jgi:hypothetical protein
MLAIVWLLLSLHNRTRVRLLLLVLGVRVLWGLLIMCVGVHDGRRKQEACDNNAGRVENLGGVGAAIRYGRRASGL